MFIQRMMFLTFSAIEWFYIYIPYKWNKIYVYMLCILDKGDSWGTRAGRKIKDGRQARKDFVDTSHTKRILAAKYEANDLSRAEGTGMLLRTVTNECSVNQSAKGYIKTLLLIIFWYWDYGCLFYRKSCSLKYEQ